MPLDWSTWSQINQQIMCHELWELESVVLHSHVYYKINSGWMFFWNRAMTNWRLTFISWKISEQQHHACNDVFIIRNIYFSIILCSWLLCEQSCFRWQSGHWQWSIKEWRSGNCQWWGRWWRWRWTRIEYIDDEEGCFGNLCQNLCCLCANELFWTCLVPWQADVSIYK